MIRALFRPAVPVFALILGLAACATTPSGKSVVSAAALGTDLVQAGNAANLAAALNDASPSPIANASTQLRQAAAGLTAAGTSLAQSGTVSGDLSANVNLAYQGFEAAIAGAKASGDPNATATADKVQSYLDVALALLAIYNAGAPGAGLPLVPVPAA